MSATSHHTWSTEWRDAVVEAAGFRCTPASLGDSDHWSFDDGAIRHSTGRFFSVVGIEDETGRTQPILDQSEVGLLAFLVDGHMPDPRWLAQMKVEPGNAGVAQLAPTIQATRSNLDRVHGGCPTPFSDGFEAGPEPLADGLWSEQGDRFLGKRNRNVTAVTTTDIDDTLHHRWIRSSDLRAGLATDYAVNTDARSVIATAPWTLIGGPHPFSGDLRRSHEHGDDDAPDRIRAALASGHTSQVRRIPLEGVAGAVLGDGPTPLRHRSFDIVHRTVEAAGREVPAWDQPLVSSPGRGTVTLVLRRSPDGILRADLPVDRSPALTHGPELTATVTRSPGRSGPAPPSGHAIATVEVTDEGGRFDQAVSRVTVLITGDAPDNGPRALLSLGDLERVVRSPMGTTNELRTAVALLLSLA